MKKKILALSLAGVMLLGLTYAYAQGPGFGPGHRHEGRPEVWSSLTPEQKTRLQELQRKFTEDTAQLRGSLLTKRLELQSLWRNPKADEKAIQEKEKELRDLQNQMMDRMVQHRLEARKLLTPEQIASSGPRCGMGPGFGLRPMKGQGMGCGMGYGMGSRFGTAL